MPLFEVAIVEKEQCVKGGQNLPERLVLGPLPVLAKDKQSAGNTALLDNADALKSVDRQRMEVLVRPFLQ